MSERAGTAILERRVEAQDCGCVVHYRRHANGVWTRWNAQRCNRRGLGPEHRGSAPGAVVVPADKVPKA